MLQALGDLGTVSQEQLEHLLQLNFDCPTIASILGVSLRTVRRRMADYSLSSRSCYSSNSDAELDHAVQQLKEHFRNSGYRMIDGLLRPAWNSCSAVASKRGCASYRS